MDTHKSLMLFLIICKVYTYANYIVVPKKMVQAPLGASPSFTCQVSDPFGGSLRWKDNLGVTLSTNGVSNNISKYSVTGNHTAGEYIFTILELTESDYGVYSCEQFGKGAHTTNLTKAVPCNVTFLAYGLTIRFIATQEDKVNLTIVTENGIPPPIFTLNITNNNNVCDNITRDTSTGRDFIVQICSQEPKNITFTVGVDQAPALLDPVMYNFTVQFTDPPSVTISQNMSTTEGSTVQLECNVTGFPVPNVQWSTYTNSSVIGNGSIYSFTATDQSEGCYVCNATSTAGVDTASTCVTVIPQTTTEDPTTEILSTTIQSTTATDTSTSSTSTTTKATPTSGLSQGAIIGIAVGGSVAVIIIIVVVLVCCCCMQIKARPHRNKDNKSHRYEYSNDTYMHEIRDEFPGEFLRGRSSSGSSYERVEYDNRMYDDFPQPRLPSNVPRSRDYPRGPMYGLPHAGNVHIPRQEYHNRSQNDWNVNRADLYAYEPQRQSKYPPKQYRKHDRKPMY